MENNNMEILDLNDQLARVTRSMSGLSGLLDGYREIPVTGSEICALIEVIRGQIVTVEEGTRTK